MYLVAIRFTFLLKPLYKIWTETEDSGSHGVGYEMIVFWDVLPTFQDDEP
jgi:hypothetical protein